MKSKSRLTLVVVAISAILVSLALYQPILAVSSNEKAEQPKWHESYTMEMQSGLRLNRRPMLKLRLLRNCEPETVEGNIVTYVKRTLVLDTGEEQVKVIVPYLWMVGGEAMNMTEIFDSGILSPGDSVTVNALRWDIENEELSIYILFGYEIEHEGEVLYALLPINIEE
ncbi:hypothetical protein DRO47_01995 [Candidatus Bathyarchaeota archaeon]|nr:MAG: hypothetical protein DRO47_01995 [Candidatus Bathyarchaeota archaeon]